MIACVDSNMGLGKDNKLLTHLPKDLKHFREVTEGNVVVFGKNTWDSLPIKPLPNRKNAVLTRHISFHIPQVWTLNSVEDILWMGKHDERDFNVFICGGEEVYRQMMPYADELIISHMDASFEADTFFPEIDEDKWIAYHCEGVEDLVPFEIVKYKRKGR